LDFGGDEIYIKPLPVELSGATFAESLSAFRDSAVLGICSPEGTISLNPEMNTRLKPNDSLVVISEDDDTVRMNGHAPAAVQEDCILGTSSDSSSPERTLILGWNRRAHQIITELDHYVHPGSVVTILADQPGIDGEVQNLQASLINQRVEVCTGDTTDRVTLNRINVASYHHIITLCYSDLLETQEADARTLVTLLQLRDISRLEGHSFSIVSEIMDVRNRILAENTKADDFIVGEHLISLMLTQVSECKPLNAVFEDLFDPEGSEVYLKPVEEYIRPGQPVNFYTLLESARRRGQVAFGYRLKAYSNEAAHAYGVVINPEKDAAVTFHPGDKVIVLAEY
jgi:hypothetical protein